MNLKNKFLPAMLVFGVVALSSCEKTERETAEPLLEQGTLSHVMLDSAEVTSYKFAGKKLNQVNHYNPESGELESFEKYEYDGKGKLLKSTSHAAKNHALLSEQTYEYATNGNLNQTTTSYFSGNKKEYSSYNTFEYSSENKITKQSTFEAVEGAEEGKLRSYTAYEVLPNGNYSQEKLYVVDDKGQSKLFSTTTYSYDSHNNPLFEFAEPGTISSQNNLTAAATLIQSSKKNHTYSYAYTYDERGYPLSQTVTSPNGKRETFSYLYSN